MNHDEEDLIRWWFVIAGFSRTRLARDVGCSIGDIEGIVSSGLGRMFNPLGNANKRKLLATPPQPQTVTPKTEREWLIDILRTPFDTTQALVVVSFGFT